MRVFNVTQGVALIQSGEVAQTFYPRLKGLLFTRQLLPGHGLLIRPCKSVHTFGMKYSIDIVFIDARNTVVKTALNVNPGRIVTCISSAYVVEVPAGTVAITGTTVGDKLELLEAGGDGS